MFTVDDFVKVVLVLSIAFTLIGITIQIMRMMGGFIESIKLGNNILDNVTIIVDKFTGDYDFLSEQIKMIVETVSKFVNGVLGPIAKFTGFIKSFGGGSSTKSKKSGKEENEESVEEEE